jgi:hypothetical protein
MGDVRDLRSAIPTAVIFTLNQDTLPTYIVPIRSHWAMQLFDEPASHEDLFGAEPSLLLRRENVYYRSARPVAPKAPCRVLWYVSGGGPSRRARHLVGCSLVTAVSVGEARNLYRRFERLGAFRWLDVLRVAKGEARRNVLAFTFGHTELFRNPVEWASLRTLLAEHGLRGTTLQCPVRVSDSLFWRVYEQQV